MGAGRRGPANSGLTFKSRCHANLTSLHIKTACDSIAEAWGRGEDLMTLFPGPHQQDVIARHLRQAIAFHQQNQLAQARGAYEDILRIDPGHPEALQYLAALCFQSGNLGDAERFYKRAINADASSPVLHANHGSVLHQLARYEEAVACYQKALAINPDYADACYNLANSLHALQRFDAAIIHYQKALVLNPAHADTYYNLGNTFQKLNRFDDAIAIYDRVTAIDPGYALAFLNQGNALRELRLYDEAIIRYDKALSIKPDFTEAFCNRGGVLKDLKRFNEALASYLQALSIDPNDAEVYWNISLTLLLLGNFKDGLAFYEWRKRIRNPLGNRQFPKPLWLGRESLDGKKILIHEEQGIGDIIQFSRYLPLLEARGADVIFAVSPRLGALASSLGGHIEVCAIDGPLPDFDFHCPLISLPHACNTDVSSIPATTPYLFADAARVADLRRDLSQDGTRKICGLSWLSNNSATGKSRSVALSDLIDAIDSRDYIFVNLQYGDVAQEIADLRAEKGVSVRSIPSIDNYHDLDGFAALVDACDTIVTIDNTTAHMAGALNKRTFLLLPFVPDWRWLLDREDSPWYPSLRLLRQSVDGDWTDVLIALNTALQGVAALAPLV